MTMTGACIFSLIYTHTHGLHTLFTAAEWQWILPLDLGLMWFKMFNFELALVFRVKKEGQGFSIVSRIIHISLKLSLL